MCGEEPNVPPSDIPLRDVYTWLWVGEFGVATSGGISVAAGVRCGGGRSAGCIVSVGRLEGVCRGGGCIVHGRLLFCWWPLQSDSALARSQKRCRRPRGYRLRIPRQFRCRTGVGEGDPVGSNWGLDPQPATSKTDTRG